MKTIKIRSNINATIDTIQRLEKEREEEEKRKRDEEYETRQRLAKEWQDAHPNLFKYTYASYHNKDSMNYDYGPTCKIHFYEWSDIHREPIQFANFTRLYAFLDECGLFITSDDNSRIRSMAACYITCKPGCKDLIVCPTYEGLSCEFKKVQDTIQAIAAVPEI